MLIRTAGLRPTAEGKRVRLRHGKLVTIDGPFTETKEVIGAFAILEAQATREAVELTERFLRIHGDEWDIECELRQLDGPEFGNGTWRASMAEQVAFSEYSPHVTSSQRFRVGRPALFDVLAEHRRSWSVGSAWRSS